MNDPGLDEPAAQAAEDVEANNTYVQDKEQAEEEEQEFLKPGYTDIPTFAFFNPLISVVDGGLHLQHVH